MDVGAWRARGSRILASGHEQSELSERVSVAPSPRRHAARGDARQRSREHAGPGLWEYRCAAPRRVTAEYRWLRSNWDRRGQWTASHRFRSPSREVRPDPVPHPCRVSPRRSREPRASHCGSVGLARRRLGHRRLGPEPEQRLRPWGAWRRPGLRRRRSERSPRPAHGGCRSRCRSRGKLRGDHGPARGERRHRRPGAARPARSPRLQDPAARRGVTCDRVRHGVERRDLRPWAEASSWWRTARRRSKTYMSTLAPRRASWAIPQWSG